MILMMNTRTFLRPKSSDWYYYLLQQILLTAVGRWCLQNYNSLFSHRFLYPDFFFSWMTLVLTILRPIIVKFCWTALELANYAIWVFSMPTILTQLSSSCPALIWRNWLSLWIPIVYHWLIQLLSPCEFLQRFWPIIAASYPISKSCRHYAAALVNGPVCSNAIGHC